jgi:flagellar M-ring protein FliF
MRLVAGAVDELKPNDVAIIDSDSNQTLGSTSDPSDSNRTEEQALTQRLIATLSPVVGTDHIHATVNLEYETGSSEESQEKYDPTVTTPLNMQRTEENISGSASVGGVPGTSSNVLAAKPMKLGALAPEPVKDPGQSSKSESATYAVNKTTRHIVEPAGSIKRLTAAVLVDDIVERKQERGKWTESYRKRSPDDLKLITELAQAAIGFNSARGDVISVQNLSFDHIPVLDDPKLTLADKTREGLRDYSAAIRYSSFLALFGLVYMLMIRPVQKRALSQPDPLWSAASLSGNQGFESTTLAENPSLISQRTLQLKKQLSDFVQAEPENSAVAVRAWLQEESQ